jgi:GNAT superfamily N-acetyltransferase
MSTIQAAAQAVIRKAGPDDVAACSDICFTAFKTINEQHNFPPDIPAPELATHFFSWMFTHPAFYCVVAEIDGRIVGSNCLDERSVIAGVGPITVDPNIQNARVGRRLMQVVIDRAKENGANGIRLVQAAFHNRSLSLYTNLGFDVRESLTCLQGRTTQRSLPGCTVRPATSADIPACNELALQIHGFERGRELAEGIQRGSALAVERGGRITGYASSLAFFGHATAETNLDMQALLASVESFGGPGILLPMRNSALFRWCLSQGLRVVQPMTLMSKGLYNEPKGAWLPSITF